MKSEFDDKAAREIAPGRSLYYADAGYPGLQLTAPQSGTWRSWTYRYRQPGKRGTLRQVKLGVWPAMSWPKAIAAWVKARDERFERAQSGGA